MERRDRLQASLATGVLRASAPLPLVAAQQLQEVVHSRVAAASVSAVASAWLRQVLEPFSSSRLLPSQRPLVVLLPLGAARHLEDRPSLEARRRLGAVPVLEPPLLAPPSPLSSSSSSCLRHSSPRDSQRLATWRVQLSEPWLPKEVPLSSSSSSHRGPWDLAVRSAPRRALEQRLDLEIRAAHRIPHQHSHSGDNKLILQQKLFKLEYCFWHELLQI